MATKITDTPGAIGYGELIRGNANFRFLWFGQIISLLGDWFNLIASASLIAILTGSGFAVGSLFVVRMLTPFLVSPIAGVVADRYNRKHIIIATDIARSITLFCFLLIRDPSQVWLLYTLTAIQFCMSGFFFPTRSAILPDIVPSNGIGAANALSAATWSVMLAVGAALGGIVAGTWGIYPAFVIDGFTYILSAIFIARIKLSPKPGSDPSVKPPGTAIQQYLDGLRYLGGRADILVIALHKATLSLLSGSTFEVVEVAIAKDKFVIGVGGGLSLGMMLGIAGIGTGIGPILARYFTKDRDRYLRLAIIFGYLLMAIGYVIVAPLINFPTALAGIILRGMGGGIVWVFSTQLLLQLVPPQVRGRVFATEHALFTLMGAAGAAIVGGALDSSLGISGVVWGMAGLILIPSFLWALWIGTGKSARPVPEDGQI